MLNDYKTYYIALLAFGVAGGLISFWFLKIKEENISSNEKIPRNVIFGIILGFLSLLWCIPHSEPLLPNSMHRYLLPAAFVLTWVGYQFMDYLFSRAMGGFMILLSHYFLSSSFTYHTPAKILFTLFCFAFGTVGIFFAGKPHLMRDLIRKCSCNKKWKYSTTGFLGAFSLLSLILGIIHLVRK